MKPKVTRRNHYLPQLYLKPFLTNRQFWVYYKGTKKVIAQTPINTCVEKDIYNFDNPDGSINDGIEKALGTTENTVKDIIEKLLKPKSRLETSDVPELAVFLSFMATRVPRTFNLAEEIGKEIALNILKKSSKNRDKIESMLQELNLEKEFTVDEVTKLFENPEEYFKLSLNKKLAMAMSLHVSRDIYHQLMDMNWCLCRASSGCYFITSDAPLVPFVLERGGYAIIGTGFGLNNVEVTIPISPYSCLFMNRKRIQRNRAVNKAFVFEINRRTAWNAERIIISNIKTKYVENLNAWASKSLDTPKIDKKIFNELLDKGRK